MEHAELLVVMSQQMREIAEQLDRIEKRLSASVVKEGYTVSEVAERVGRTAWVVRQWCNLGQAKAKKVRGRGEDGEWRVPHDEVLRLQADGPMPEGTFQNRKGFAIRTAS